MLLDAHLDSLANMAPGPGIWGAQTKNAFSQRCQADCVGSFSACPSRPGSSGLLGSSPKLSRALLCDPE